MVRVLAILTAIVLGVGGPLDIVLAQEHERCFDETGQCLSGLFRRFWEENGGLDVFGYPVSPAAQEPNRDTGQVYLTQWFQRNRFELHGDRVMLGRLGDDRLRQLGIDWQREPAAPERPECLYFEQSGHNVCDQTEEAGFVRYYVSRGLNDPALDEFGRSLALFGLPLTEARPERNASGDLVLTQWFERARFEWHPANPEPFRVLLGLLGSEVRAGQPAATEPPMPPNAPPARGAVLYAELGCVRCHGVRGEGGRGPRITPGRRDEAGWVALYRRQHGSRVAEDDLRAIYTWLRGD